MAGFSFGSSIFGASSGGSILGDWMAIRNGSYKRMLKAYYAKEKESSSDSKSSSTTANKKLDATETKQLTNANTDASELKASANALNKKNLFQKVSTVTKDETGKEVTTTDYDRNAIYSAVKSFVDSYNNTLDSASSQNNTTILRRASNMTQSTSLNRSALRSIGITIGKDNKLSINEAKFKESDMGTVKTLFSGHGSYASGIGQKAADIASISDQMVKSATKGNASLYTQNGGYKSYTSGSAFDKFF